MQLFPAGASNFTCCTHLDADIRKPIFGEVFSFSVTPRRLSSKTIQINVWAVKGAPSDLPDEECVVSTMLYVSLSTLVAYICIGKWRQKVYGNALAYIYDQK